MIKSLCTHFLWLPCKSARGLCFQASVWRKQLGRRGECQRIWDSFCSVSHVQFSVACLPLRHAAFKDYRWLRAISFLASDTERKERLLCGLEQRLLMVLQSEPFQQMSLWALESQPPQREMLPALVSRTCSQQGSNASVAMVPNYSCLGAANFGCLLSATRAEPCQPSFHLGQMHEGWRQRSWDRQWQDAWGWWASLCDGREMHDSNEQGYELSLSDRDATAEKQQLYFM